MQKPVCDLLSKCEGTLASLFGLKKKKRRFENLAWNGTLVILRLITSRHIFIPFRVGIWEDDQCAQSLLGHREKKQLSQFPSVLPLMHREFIKPYP